MLEPLIDFACLLLLAWFFIRYLPLKELSGPEPATGGDMGSHFFPLVTLVKHGIPNWTPRVWNPGNLGGEPHLVHYFPFPYLLMAVLSIFMPLGKAFNWGTLLPLLLLPSSVYVCLRGLGSKFPVPILGAAASVCFLLNESYSMWGGNAVSTLAGQFAHVYGLVLLLLGIGALGREIRRGYRPYLSALLFAALTLSHAYVMLGLPFFFVSFIWLFPHQTQSKRFWTCFWSGALAVLFSLWFIIPMVDNSKWTTEFSIEWNSGKLIYEVLPVIFYPAIAILVTECITLCIHGRVGSTREKVARLLGIVGSVVAIFTLTIIVRYAPDFAATEFSYYFDRVLPIVCGVAAALAVVGVTGLPVRRPAVDRARVLALRFWMIPICGYLYYYFQFPRIGLVDVRAFPQAQLFLCILAGSIVGRIIGMMGRIPAYFLALPLAVVTMWWTDVHVTNFPNWTKWNYSGWQTKPLYPDLAKLSEELKGNFSMPRVVYEHNDVNNGAGTVRVFEMIPYFMNRATLESLYLQASILAPMAFLIQADVSKTPSCPFRQYECRAYDLGRAKDSLNLMGVGELILTTTELLEQANKSSYLEPGKMFGPWQLFHAKHQPRLAGLLLQRPDLIDAPNWKRIFYDWFKTYEVSKPFLVLDRELPPALRELIVNRTEPWPYKPECEPTVDVDFSRLVLRTPCPGVPHYLKFAYHPSWVADTGDDPFIVSPGFIGIVPSKEVVVLKFGQRLVWQLAGFISIAVFVVVYGIGLMGLLKRGRHRKS